MKAKQFAGLAAFALSLQFAGADSFESCDITFDAAGGTFVANGETGTTNMTVACEEFFFAPEVEQKGYRLDGWYDSDADEWLGWYDSDADEWFWDGGFAPAASHAEYVAQWIPQCEVVFDAGEAGVITNLFDCDECLVAPEEISIEGYSVEWFDEDDNLMPTDVPASHAASYYQAKWTVNQYTAAFYPANGGEVTEVTLDYGAALTAPEVTPPSEGWVFVGWEPAVPETMPAASHTYVAQWKYTLCEVVFDANGGKEGVVTNTLAQGAKLVAPAVTLEGYSAEWFDPDGQPMPAVVPAASHASYVAKWTVNSYTATFDANGGTGGKSVKVAYGAALAAPAVSRTGYTFVGWSPAVPKTMPAKDVTCMAQWKATIYQVKFNKNGGKGKAMKAQSFTYDTAAKLSKNTFKRKGYVFAGWATSKKNAKKGIIAFKNAQSVKNLTANGGNVTLYAVWAKPTYKVKFFANGGTGEMAVQTFKYGKAKKLSANKFKAPKGKKFAGWATSKKNAKKGKVVYKNKKKVKDLVTTGKTVKLYAVWKKRK